MNIINKYLTNDMLWILFLVNIIITLYFILYKKSGIIENFSKNTINDEALQNISSIYNKKILEIDNILATGNITATGKISANSFNLLPSGLIVAYNGRTAPHGWVICNGNNNTPDLRNRFILGAGNVKMWKQVGGTEKITLSIENMPKHNHEIKNLEHLATCTGGDGNCNWKDLVKLGTNTKSWKGLTTTSGLGKAYENMPPYYVLTYIMKI